MIHPTVLSHPPSPLVLGNRRRWQCRETGSNSTRAASTIRCLIGIITIPFPVCPPLPTLNPPEDTNQAEQPMTDIQKERDVCNTPAVCDDV